MCTRVCTVARLTGGHQPMCGCSLRRQNISSFWDWRCNKGNSSSLSTKYPHYICAIPVWRINIKFKYLFMFPQNTTAHEGFNIWFMTSPIMIDTPWWAGKCPTSAFGGQQQHQNTLSSSITLNIYHIHTMWSRIIPPDSNKINVKLIILWKTSNVSR